MSDQKKSLIRAYADEKITRDQFTELEQLLWTDANFREQFLHDLNLHAALEDLALAESERIVGVQAASHLSLWERWLTKG